MIRPSSGSLVADPSALSGLAGRPLFRGAQLAELCSCIAGTAKGWMPSHAWIHGPSGSGKTHCARFLLKTKIPAEGYRPVYVNCASRFTFLSMIEAILDVVRPLHSPQRTREYHVQLLQQVLSEGKYSIVLDEIDLVGDQEAGDLLYHLARIPTVSIVCIAPSRRLLFGLPQRVISRFSPRQILFPRYSQTEISGLVRLIAEHGLKPGGLPAASLEVIADKSYGDARRASAMLRLAAQEAERCRAAEILQEHIESIRIPDRMWKQTSRLAPLTSHHKLLVSVAAARGPLSGTQLESRYRRKCERAGLTPVAPRTISKYLGVLCERRVLRREHGAGTSGWVYREA